MVSSFFLGGHSCDSETHAPLPTARRTPLQRRDARRCIQRRDARRCIQRRDAVATPAGRTPLHSTARRRRHTPRRRRDVPRHFHRRDAVATLARRRLYTGGTPSLQLPAGAEKIAVVKDKPKEIKLLDDEFLVVGPTPFAHPCETRGGDVIGQPMPDDV